MDNSEVLKLNAELSLQLANYWYEIDLNGGRNASSYYTEDAEFHGQSASYLGRAKIQQFYDWRIKQGPRLSLHSFANFRAWFTGNDTAEATNYLCLYAANGVPVLPTHPPISVSLATDRYRRSPDGRWLCTYRRFEHYFEGGTPITNPNLDNVPA